jgi:hypothetical protein
VQYGDLLHRCGVKSTFLRRYRFIREKPEGAESRRPLSGSRGGMVRHSDCMTCILDLPGVRLRPLKWV